jgi:hypothetical protein
MSMPRSLKHAVAVWFVIQILVPFTAPLQTCDFHDLFGPVGRHHGPALPELSSTPEAAAIVDAESAGGRGADSALGSSPARTLLGECDRTFLFGPALGVTLVPNVQQTVLRL